MYEIGHRMALAMHQWGTDMYFDKLSLRVRNRLLRAGIDNDEALVARSREELLRIRDFGCKAIDEINEKVRIPMGLEPYPEPPKKPIHPNRLAGIRKAAVTRRERNAERKEYLRSKEMNQ